MYCKLLKIKGNGIDVKNSARTTINKDKSEIEPTTDWKRNILLSEHSPTRQLIISAKGYDLPSWVSVHLCRHKFGIDHFVRTQRTDRVGIDRNELPQGSLVEHEVLLNAQALINISRKRLCNQASPETREAGVALLLEINSVDPELVSACVSECVYRGGCYEFKSCNYHKSDHFKVVLRNYRDKLNE